MGFFFLTYLNIFHMCIYCVCFSFLTCIWAPQWTPIFHIRIYVREFYVLYVYISIFLFITCVYKFLYFVHIITVIYDVYCIMCHSFICSFHSFILSFTLIIHCHSSTQHFSFEIVMIVIVGSETNLCCISLE